MRTLCALLTYENEQSMAWAIPWSLAVSQHFLMGMASLLLAWCLFSQLLFSQMCCCYLRFEKLHRGPLGAQSASGCDPPVLPPVFLMPPKRRRGVLPPEWVGGRSWSEAAQLESFSAGLGRAGLAPNENCFPTSVPPSSHKIFSWFLWEVTLH